MSFYEIFFSPTGGTKKTADILMEGLGDEFVSVDLIKNPDKLSKINFTENDICLFAVPSYGGRVPTVVSEKLKVVKGNGAKAVLAAIFGNRAIDDTLMELQDVLEKCGFTCLAGLKAVAEHSLMHQFGAGRPDAEDEKELRKFASRIKEKYENFSDSGKLSLPGNHTYREYHGVPLKPVANRKCEACGLCAKECPAGAIPKENPRVTDKEKCISCMHCVSVCPKNARHYSRLLSFVAAQKMGKTCSDRKENKLYL